MLSIKSIKYQLVSILFILSTCIKIGYYLSFWYKCWLLLYTTTLCRPCYKLAIKFVCFFIFYKNFRVVNYAPKFSMTNCFIIVSILSITDSFGSRANNFSTVLQKGCIFRFWIYLSNEWGKYKACLPDFNSNVHDQISLTLVKINP